MGGLAEDGASQGQHRRGVLLGHRRANVAPEVGPAALPGGPGVRQEFADIQLAICARELNPNLFRI